MDRITSQAPILPFHSPAHALLIFYSPLLFLFQGFVVRERGGAKAQMAAAAAAAEKVRLGLQARFLMPAHPPCAAFHLRSTFESGA